MEPAPKVYTRQSYLSILKNLRNISEPKNVVGDRAYKIEAHFNHLVKVYTVQWVKLRLRGLDPHKCSVKRELEKTKLLMLSWEESRANKDPTSIASIHDIFNRIYEM